MAPLMVTVKAHFEWEWTAVHQAALAKFEEVILELATDLSPSEPQQPYQLDTDASKDRVRPTLAQLCAYSK